MKTRCAYRPPPLKPNGYLKRRQAKDERFKKLQDMEGLLRRSPRLKLLRAHETPAPQKRKAFNWDSSTKEEKVERLLCDYNKKHGTNLEFVGLLAEKDKCFLGLSEFIDFQTAGGMWHHFNFVARLADAPSSSDKQLVLYAELVQQYTKYHLVTLSIVKPSDESNGCIRCINYASHPRHGFRAGLSRKPNISCGPEEWSEQAAAKLSEFALQGYNKKHGTSIKFERALKCNSFVCSGLTMDFSEKTTKWVHMNFEVRVGEDRWEKVVCLFGEMYLEDDGEYVLATLSSATPLEWRKKEYTGVKGCLFCPADILHPEACRFAERER